MQINFKTTSGSCDVNLNHLETGKLLELLIEQAESCLYPGVITLKGVGSGSFAAFIERFEQTSKRCDLIEIIHGVPDCCGLGSVDPPKEGSKDGSGDLLVTINHSSIKLRIPGYQVGEWVEFARYVGSKGLELIFDDFGDLDDDDDFDDPIGVGPTVGGQSANLQ